MTLRLGDTAPDFEQESTAGPIRFHEWLGDGWGVRNFDEILRVIDSLQLTDHHAVATPGNWKAGEDVVIVPSLTDPDEIRRRFPKGHTAVRPYLRLTPDPR